MSISLCATPARSNAKPSRLRRRNFQKIALPARRVPYRLARAQDVHRLLLQVARAFRRRDHERAAAVTDDAAIQQMQRRRDDSRREHVLDRDRIAILRHRIHRRMQPHRDRNLGQLLRGRPVVMHVPLRDHRVRPYRRRPERNLVLVAWIATAAASAAARADREPRRRRRRSINYDAHIAQPGMNRGGRMGRMRHERRPANRGRIDEVRRQVQVIAEADDPHPAHPDSGRAQPVDVLDRQAGVVERATHALRHYLEQAFVRRESRRMLEHSGHCGLAA